MTTDLFYIVCNRGVFFGLFVMFMEMTKTSILTQHYATYFISLLHIIFLFFVPLLLFYSQNGCNMTVSSAVATGKRRAPCYSGKRAGRQQRPLDSDGRRHTRLFDRTSHHRADRTMRPTVTMEIQQIIRTVETSERSSYTCIKNQY
jgi:hypothetical protein